MDRADGPMPGALGRRVRHERQDRHLSVRGFARQVGVSAPFVTDIEAGRRWPSPATLARIAHVLGVPLAELEALDTRLTPELQRWIAERPRVGRLLRTLYHAPDRARLLDLVEAEVARASGEDGNRRSST
jgi:transcriptional regulator with XRE-family HTH domain